MVILLWTTSVHRRSHLHLLRSNELEIEGYGYGVSHHIQQYFIDIVEETGVHGENHQPTARDTSHIYSKLIIVSLSCLSMAFCATKYLNDGSRLYNIRLRAMVMVSNYTFNHISVIP